MNKLIITTAVLFLTASTLSAFAYSQQKEWIMLFNAIAFSMSGGFQLAAYFRRKYP